MPNDCPDMTCFGVPQLPIVSIDDKIRKHAFQVIR